MIATRILETYKRPVWEEIKKHLDTPDYPEVFKIPKKFKAYEKMHWSAVREYPKRKGKYFRPTLLILAAQAMGARLEDAIKIAAAMQVSEDWLLIHDDIEDDSVKRRGKPALHKIYDTGVAINAGDALHAIMWRMIFESQENLGHAKTIRLISEFNKMLERTVMGQTAELMMTKSGKIGISKDEYFFIVDSKTAYYTIAGPMRLGAIVAGATNSQLAKISQFGVYLGRCYQIVDDILDATSDFSGLKEKGNDIYEGKRTLLLSHLSRSIAKGDKKRFSEIIRQNRDEKKESDVDWVISKMEELGSIDYAKKIADEYKKMAFLYLEKELTFICKNPARDYLETLLDYVLERDH